LFPYTTLFRSPRYLSSHGLRRLLLVAPEHELVSAVLLPGLGLKPDGRRVLAGLHDCIPLRAGRKCIGHDAFYGLPQGHVSSPPGVVITREAATPAPLKQVKRSEEHTSEL